MRRVEIAPGVFSSILGFGCAPILGSVGGLVAARAIDCALDCDVNHFDLARSYGYGEAEAFVGKCLKYKRERVVLASKFGIRANWKSSLLKPLKPLVRALRNNKPKQIAAQDRPAETPSVTVADRFHDRIALTPESMKSSLETSLKALRTDYLDVFFVHEPLTRLEHVEDLIQAGQELKKTGKIKALGLAFPWNTLASHTNYLSHFDILQFDNSPATAHYRSIHEARAKEGDIFFSPLRQRVGSAQDTLKHIWRDFPHSVILCSMFREEHIRLNAEWATSLES